MFRYTNNVARRFWRPRWILHVGHTNTRERLAAQRRLEKPCPPIHNSTNDISPPPPPKHHKPIGG